MSYADISPAAVLAEIRTGHNTRAALADRFEVLPGSRFLADAIGTLIAHDEVRVGSDGRLTANDTTEEIK